MDNMPFVVAEMGSPLYVDAYAVDGDRWVFASFWGQETAVQEFLARLSLPSADGGLKKITLSPCDPSYSEQVLHVGKVDDLKRMIAKTPGTTILGVLCNVWIFDPALQGSSEPGDAYLVMQEGESESVLVDRLWQLIKNACHLPLLDHWQDCFMTACYDQGWIATLTGVGITGYHVSLPQAEVEAFIEEGLQRRLLSVSSLGEVIGEQQPLF